MKKLVALLFVGCLSLNLMGQTVSDTKVQINKIKRSQSYLSAEATMATEDEAMNTAKELLVSEINDWVASKKKNTPVKQIVLQDINSCTQLMDMKRGVKTRAFVYVNKKDIVLIYGEGQLVLTDEEKGGVELQPLDEVSKSQSLSAEVSSSIDKVQPVKEKTVNLVAAKDEKTVVEHASEELVELKPIVSNDTTDPLKQIMGVRTMQELKPVFAKLKEKGEITFGVYSQMDSDCYLLFYTRTGEIKGILRQESGEHKNVRTGNSVKITDYNGCGAYWFKLR